MNKYYHQQEPSPELSGFIKSFWGIDSLGDESIHREKIIPDGYPEMIFHSGDVYKTNIDGKWQVQGKDLIAGQITNHFFLENTGTTKIFALKLQPWTLHDLFQIDMQSLKNLVVEIPVNTSKCLEQVKAIAIETLPFQEKVELIEKEFLALIEPGHEVISTERRALELMIENKGRDNLKTLHSLTNTTERKLERYFKSHVGLSPKAYSRIIRFSHIFNLIQEEKIKWSEVVYPLGFYDQSHFIKNFKEFTGEHPSRYPFFEENIANFFLKK